LNSFYFKITPAVAPLKYPTEVCVRNVLGGEACMTIDGNTDYTATHDLIGDEL